MNPFRHPYSPLNNHAWNNIPQQPTIERYRNQINYMSHEGLNQSHISYPDPTPPYGWRFQNDGFPADNFSPHQTVRPRNPFVTPGFQDDDGSADIFLRPQIARPIDPVVVPPERLINPFVASGFQYDDGCTASFFQHETTRPTNHESTPPARWTNPVAISPARRTNSVAISPARLTNRAAGLRGRPTNPVVAPRAKPFWCNICRVRMSGPKSIEEHNKGKNHQNMLKKHERSEFLRRRRRRREREKVPSAPLNSVDQSKTVQKSEREIFVERRKDYLENFVVETSNVPVEKAKGEQRDNSVTRGYDSKRKIGVTNGGSDENQIKRIRRTIEASKHEGESRHNSVSEGYDSKRKFRGNGGSNHKNNIKQSRGIASSKPEGELRHKSVAEGHDSKLKSGGTSGGNDEKIKKRRRVIESSKSDINAPSNCAAAESNLQVSTVAPPEQSMPMPLQVLLPEPAVGSDSEPQIQPLLVANLEHQSSEAIVNHKSLITTDETNVRLSSSISLELDAPVNSSTNNEIPNGNCKVEEKMEVLDISPLAIYVESTVQDPTAAPPQKPTPLQELSPSPLEGSNSEPVIQPSVQVELEHRVSEDNEHYESQHPTDETNVYHPSSNSMEFDAPADSSTNTEISNENSIAEEDIEVLTDLRIASIVQETVCFVCGDRGFSDLLVYCNKCWIWARHMYCLDGPVVFTEDVTWVCEDCESMAVETFLNEKPTFHRSRSSDSPDLEDAIQTRMEETNFTRQVEEISKFKKECQATLKDTANSVVETVPVENSQVADLNLIDSEDHIVAQPIDDPIWRGSLHLCNGSIVSISGLSAYTSTLACSRVSENTRLFPEKLSMGLLQRRAVWPNLFSKYGTDRDSIALYFFPDERSEKDFYKLVDDIIHSDLALRAVLEHVELLIFPSTMLPNNYRRINAKYYLWGVFKSNKSSSNTK